jgi:hypothetical protein
MKQLLAGLITLALMGFLLYSGLRRAAPEGAGGGLPISSSEASDPSPGPEARVRSLLADASAGDVPAYLAAFAPNLRARLEREADENGRVAFAESLRAAANARKSHAVFAAEPDGPDASKVVVEAVYPDRNERQTYRLERSDGGWLVADVETIRAHRPQAKFGTPASYKEPEGVPVPVEVPTGEDEAPME